MESVVAKLLIKWLSLLLLFNLIATQRNDIRMPAEWELHQRTFMCFPAEQPWSRKILAHVRKDVATIANEIVKFEPVVMFANPTEIKLARKLLDKRVQIYPMVLDDLWARDTLPVFVEWNNNGTERLMGVVFNFNGWGGKQYHRNDAKVAQKVVSMFNMEERIAKIVAEGGCFETDGRGTLLVTESSLVNRNRNDESKAEIEKELKRVLGMRKVIWFKGVIGEDITDSHIDGLLRFVGRSTVVVSRPFPGSDPDVWSQSSDEALTILKNSTDADGNPFTIFELYEPDRSKIIIEGDPSTFFASYINFFIGNGFVLVSEFGDAVSDAKARSILRKLFPGRKVVSVEVNALASGGGGIRCATCDQPIIRKV